MRFPAETIVGQTLEQAARDAHLAIEVGEQAILDAHSISLEPKTFRLSVCASTVELSRRSRRAVRDVRVPARRIATTSYRTAAIGNDRGVRPHRAGSHR